MKEGKHIFYGWWIVAGCVVITATMVPLVMSLSGKYALAVIEELQISRSQFMLVNTIVQLIGIFLSPIVSKRIASGQMKVLQVVGVMGFCISYFTYSLAQGAVHLYISSIFVGLFYWASTIIPITYMITMWFKEKRGLAMSIAMAGIGLGGTIFSQVITMFLNNYGWRTTYQLMAGIALICALPIVLFVFKSSPEEKGLVAFGTDIAPVNQSEGAIEESKNSSITVKESYSKLFFLLAMMGMFLNGLINTGALSNFPAAIQEMHDPATSANIISIYSFVGIFGKLILGWVNDRFGIVASSIFGCGSFLLAFILMLFGDRLAIMYLMAFAFGLGTPIGTVSPPLITAGVFGQKNYPEAYGLVSSVGTIGTALGSVFVASILDASGSYQTAWLFMIVFTGLTLFGWVGSYVTSRKYFNGNMELSETID
ncbi:MFS transporter [Enterococcus pseudoavium]|uniref:MFS transporter n=2 Tax=Enterococcus pseudoavium TaxID=44007 RepID=A0AAE4I2Y5_9ENTE|nr:MFS transporter [Enterococcus pseudoavium]MDT2736781.1 MFS transporter [Enterococcus pseudoavium]REC31902.1 MFS transporter [Enterococcus pseudoavium]